MTPHEKSLVRDSFAKVVPIGDTAASLFYGRLFELNPNLRPLFTSDLQEQGRKLMAMLKLVVADIDRLDQLLPAVRDLGRRHLQYGATDRDYDTVASALLWTLERGLGDDFTPETKSAWTTCYVLLAGEMKAAANGLVVLPPC
jgi:hemoglobin-like flavoprotein